MWPWGGFLSSRLDYVSVVEAVLPACVRSLLEVADASEQRARMLEKTPCRFTCRPTSCVTHARAAEAAWVLNKT